MGIRKVMITLCILLSIGALSINASAAYEPAAADSPSEYKSAQNQADWMSKVEAAKSKWQTLTDNQKAEVYKLMDEKAASEIKIMEKYHELGIIDEGVLTRFKDKMKEKVATIKDSGEFPLFAEKTHRPNTMPKKKSSL
jgi:hypothetical protein